MSAVFANFDRLRPVESFNKQRVFSLQLSFHKRSEEAIGGVLLEKVFFEISPNSQENTCARAPF